MATPWPADPRDHAREAPLDSQQNESSLPRLTETPISQVMDAHNALANALRAQLEEIAQADGRGGDRENYAAHGSSPVQRR
jgi:hypothetical protein